jgi:ferritin-like metal-binding protein YciE
LTSLRVPRIFELLDKPARGKTCPAVDGIIQESLDILEEYKGAPTVDAGLVAAAQAIEHYEIARYGTLIAWAGQLGMKDAVKLLQATLHSVLAHWVKAVLLITTERAQSIGIRHRSQADFESEPRHG